MLKKLMKNNMERNFVLLDDQVGAELFSHVSNKKSIYFFK